MPLATLHVCVAAEPRYWLLQCDARHNYMIRIIYYVGFSVSVVALIVALCIFCFFR